MKQTFYSNGKLLITGEYLVLDGAKALALPTRFGQDLVVSNAVESGIGWKSLDADGSVWFSCHFSIDAIQNGVAFEDAKINTLASILQTAYRMNPNFLDVAAGYVVETRLTFPRLWGLGTSSTLINNIAQWANVDAYELLWQSFGGSGYDIACARNNHPIIYSMHNGAPEVQAVQFDPSFSNMLYFVYLNQKQSSKIAIAAYRSKSNELAEAIMKCDHLTKQIVQASNTSAFSKALLEHEQLLAQLLNQIPVQQRLFADFDGAVKSLGAWGGDFVLAVSASNPTEYFKDKGYETIISYANMVL